MNTWWVWMILAGIFMVAEIFTAGFVLFWFGLGAALAGIVAAIGLGLVWQLIAFATISAVLFAFSRQFADKLSKKQPPGIGADRFIGKQGVVLETINNIKNTGLVRTDQDEWRALSANGNIIEEGETIEVVRVDGTRLVVQIVTREKTQEQGD